MTSNDERAMNPIASNRKPVDRLRLAVHVAGLTPLLLMIWDGYHGNLTAEPFQELAFRTGKFGLIFLVASLAVTPLMTVFGWRKLQPHRRTLGLYCFMYAVIHFCIFLVGYGYVGDSFDWASIKQTLFEKRYAFVGLAAFLILLPVALTSTKGWQKRLGRNWTKLHRLVYVAAVLVVIHFLWLVKADRREPAAWGVVIAMLLVARLPAVRRKLAAWRTRRAVTAAG